jgi:uncharacterized protein YwqG
VTRELGRDLLADLEDDEKYVEFIEKYSGSGAEHRLFGWPRVIRNRMELECQLVSNALYPRDSRAYEHPRRKELEPGAADWMLLLQVDSDDTRKMVWGDGGMLYA